MTSFADLGLNQTLLDTLIKEGYETPTPIQAGAIPILLSGKDLLGIAQTGTGKTAAFALPILHKLSLTNQRPFKRSVRTLILSPTRELASQIAENIRQYGRNLPLSVTVAFGGQPIFRQIRALERGVDILVATPGRLLDLMSQHAVFLDKVETLVLDEADQMLDLGFIHPIRQIVSMIPRERQTLLFSATMPDSIARLAKDLLNQPERVEVTPVATTAERIIQKAIFVDRDDKRALLADLLNDPVITRSLVFTRTKHGADKVVRHLDSVGIRSDAIHGNKSQPQRERALAAFRNGHVTVLIATDIAARGIDVDGVSHVINFDLPNVPEQYVHRIGRTGRAGREGNAISLVEQEDRSFLRTIEALIRQRLPIDDRRREPRDDHDRSFGAPKRPAGRPSGNGGGYAGRPAGNGGGYAGRGGDSRYGDNRAPRSDRPGSDRPNSDRPNSDRPAAARGGEERARSLGDRPYADRPRTDRPQGERSFGDRPRGDRPHSDRPHSDRPRSDRPQGERSFGDRPRSQAAAGRPAAGGKPAGRGPARRPA
jgi:ATP-dependent RNA helicase RhlE